MPKDWSLTAQGESAGKITIANKDGSKSDTIPVLTRASNANDQQDKPKPNENDDIVKPSPEEAVKPNPEENGETKDD